MKNKVLELFNAIYSKVEGDRYNQSLMAIYLFDYLDKLKMQGFPVDWFEQLEKNTQQLVQSFDFNKSVFDFSLNDFDSNDITEEDIEAKTGEVYYNLWKDFDKQEYYKQTATYLAQRFEKNNLDPTIFTNALDAGCGSGRYSLALKSLGVERVTGIDISPNSIDFANKMNSFEAVNFVQGSVLELPFEDESFDFVFSNGVLHHTLSTEKGLQELFRVLKPGGGCWLYLYGGKGNLFWDIVDFCRKLLHDVPQNYLQQLMKVMGYPPGRIFHRSDFFYVPMHRRYLEEEVNSMLKTSGFSSFKRLKRGVQGIDWDEIIYENQDIDFYIYGEGEMRYWVEK